MGDYEWVSINSSLDRVWYVHKQNSNIFLHSLLSLYKKLNFRLSEIKIMIFANWIKYDNNGLSVEYWFRWKWYICFSFNDKYKEQR